MYSASQKNPPWGLVPIFPKRLGIFQPNFICLLCVSIYARLRIFIQLLATLTYLCHVKRDQSVHIMCAKCPPSAETHAGIFWHFPQTVRNFSPNFTGLLNVHMYTRMHNFIRLSLTVSKLCHINPHQYTLRNLSIRTPGVHVDPNGISSFMMQVHDMLSQKWLLITSAMMYCDLSCLLVGWFVGECVLVCSFVCSYVR